MLKSCDGYGRVSVFMLVVEVRREMTFIYLFPLGLKMV